MAEQEQEDREHNGRSGDKRVSWQALAVIFSMLMAIIAMGKTWFINDYRIEQLEKQMIAVEVKVDRIDEKLTQLDTTYRILTEQARQHGWIVPWVPRRQ